MPKVIQNNIEDDQQVTPKQPKKVKKIKKVTPKQQPAVVTQSKPKKIQSTIQSTKKQGQTPTPAQSRDVYVSGIPYQATEQQLREIFSECGNIQYTIHQSRLIKLPRYQDSGRCRGYSHIRFSNLKEAKRALSKDGVTMGTRYLKVEPAAGQKIPEVSKQEPPIGCKTLFVKNLPYDITEQIIREVFQKYGKITQVRMVYDAYHKHFKGFCYIEYASPSSLKGGLKMNGVEYQGRRLIAQFTAKGPRKGYKPYLKNQEEE